MQDKYFLLSVRDYIVEQLGDTSSIPKEGYYHDLARAINSDKINATAIATTNYNVFIREVMERDICYLNGSTDIWYDPYVNRIGTKRNLSSKEEYFLVPLIFTQSGTKPMTSIEMSKKYVKMYEDFKSSDKICIIGFGFNQDDEHINGILRTLVDIDNKQLVIVDKNNGINIEDVKETIANKLKVFNEDNIKIVLADDSRKVEGINWLEKILL